MTEELERKELGLLEIKDEAQGLVEAIFATLNVVDKDTDVIADGAIKDGSKVKLSSYNHDILLDDQAPVGMGTVHVDGSKAVFTGRYFLTTQRGREAFNTIKEMGTDSQWSFGFKVLGAEIPDDAWKKKGASRIITKVDVFEVSPVLVGAGIGTRTVAAKAADAARAAEVEAARKAEEEQAAAAKAEAERKENEQKALTVAAMADYQRIQRTFKRLGLK